MTRRTFPRREAVHSTVAAEVLARHARSADLPVGLPVPIELIIEQTYGLQILSDEIEEPAGTMILGALDPTQRLIILNSRHQTMFDQWVGPERFTLAPELAHWIYDAESPDQLSLNLEAPGQPIFCYHREAAALNEDLRVREVNANKLAANLLLPEHLVRQADIDWVLQEFRTVAALWGVSQTTLRIRLQTLELVDGSDLALLPMSELGANHLGEVAHLRNLRYSPCCAYAQYHNVPPRWTLAPNERERSEQTWKPPTTTPTPPLPTQTRTRTSARTGRQASR